MDNLGDAIRALLKKRELNQKEFAEQIGISPVSLSRIVQGHARPRQVTFTRICKELAQNNEETQLLVRFFTGASEDLPEVEIELNEANERFEMERAERYLEMKAQSIAFKKSVARELDKVEIPYKQDYAEGIYVTDFLVEKDGKRSALECKFNVQRDLEKTVTIAEILLTNLMCDRVAIVLPYAPDPEASFLNKKSGVVICALPDLIDYFQDEA